MSASHDLPKWPTPPSYPLLPGPPIPGGAAFPLFVLGFFIPVIRPVAAAATVGIKYYNDSTLPHRRLDHATMVNNWLSKLQPVEVMHAASHKELEAAVARFRTGQVGPGSHIIVIGTYAKKLYSTHKAFCDYYAAHRDEKIKLFGHVVKLAGLTASVAAGPLGGSAQAATLAFLSELFLVFEAEREGHDKKTEIESEHIVELFDLIEISVSAIGGMKHNRWKDKKLMLEVSAKLVRELLYNGAIFSDNDGECFLIKWGEMTGHKTIASI